MFLGGAAEPIKLSAGERTFTITSSQSAPDAVVWNPGPDDIRLAKGEWQNFVCVETGAVQDHAFTLEAGRRKKSRSRLRSRLRNSCIKS
ncbi:hypothetical protein RQN30_08600 [Arcanobacterium hippocoleae]